MKKVMGITAGRKGSSSEILLKEALLACQSHGAEVTLINLRDYTILPCLGCNGCGRRKINGKIQCVQADKDDMGKIMDVLLQQDALIVSAPTYGLLPAGQYITFSQRFLAYNGAFLEALNESGAPKKMVGGVIAMGGARRAWQSMAVEVLRASLFTLSITTVDQMLGNSANMPAQVLMYDEQIARAHQVGENVWRALEHPDEVNELTYYGDPNEGWCPVCHSNSLCLGEEHWDGKRFKVECTVCGAGGDLEKQEDGSFKFVIAPNGMSKCRITKEGIVAHMHEIMDVSACAEKYKDKINAGKEKYKAIQYTKL